MHATEREKQILTALGVTGFVSYRDLEAQMDASPATIRRDLTRLANDGVIERVHGGAKLLIEHAGSIFDHGGLEGTPFQVSVRKNTSVKRAIAKAAARLCVRGEGVMIDGGSTTFQMCEFLEPLKLQVLTNSLHIVNALLMQENTRIMVPSGALFREQNIILAPSGEESMPRFYAPKLFMGAAAVGPQGVMQSDAVLVASQRRLIDRAEKVILLVDSTKFGGSSGSIVCGLDEVDVLITNSEVPEPVRRTLENNGGQVIIA